MQTKLEVQARSSARVELDYVLLLNERSGVIEHILHVDPGEALVRNLKADIRVRETKEIEKFEVRPKNTTRISKITTNELRVVWQQLNYKKRKTPLDQIVILYYLRKNEIDDAGVLAAGGGYMLHAAKIRFNKQVERRVVFVVDSSASMKGFRLQQLRKALTAALDQLTEADYFNVLHFNTKVTWWRRGELQKASAKNVEDAKDFVSSRIRPTGCKLILT